MKHSTQMYGADVTFRQATGLCIALCLGTVVEWYDFTIYSQLSSTLTSIFFPKDNPATAELAFWGVYAVGFISRPLGAVLFGHIGDSLGRRLTLLISILAITLPTAIIGALPTYAQAGIVAPVLLAVLRFIQGVAVGGEFGSAIVYLYEMAPRHRKGLIASLGQLAISPGIILGIAACLAVLYGCKPEQLEAWGWRLPFLVTVVAAPLAVILRMHMPEPYEFLHSKQEMVLQRVASTAAVKVARGFAKQHSRAGSSATELNSRQVSMRLMSITRVTLDTTTTTAGTSQAAAEAVAEQQEVSQEDPEAQALPGESSAVAQRIASPTNRGSANRHTAAYASNHHTLQEMRARELSIQSEVKLQYDHRHELDDIGCEEEFEQECQELSKKIKHHMPLMVLLKGHWKGLWLQFFLEAVYGALFYVFFSWAPPYLHTATGVSTQLTLWAVMLGMVLFAVTVPITGHLVDRGIPKVWFYMGLICIDAAVCIPVLYGLHSGSVAALLVLLPVMLGLAGCHGGLMTSIGPQIYPAGVRATGYNLGHNLAMSIWGGMTPFIVSALALVLQPPALAAGVLIVIVAVVSWIAAIPLTKVAPETNAGDGCICCSSKTADIDLDTQRCIKGSCDCILKDSLALPHTPC